MMVQRGGSIWARRGLESWATVPFKASRKMSTYTLTRTCVDDGSVRVTVCATLRDCRRLVAWCMTDNASTTRREASLISGLLHAGAPLTSHGYTFELVLS